MFGFIRNTFSSVINSVKRTATHLLIHAIEKDRRWAIRLLIWIGADCDGASEQTNLGLDERRYYESILIVAIYNNNYELALWLLNIPKIQGQAHYNHNLALLTIVENILGGKILQESHLYDHDREYSKHVAEEISLLTKIQDKLLECKLVRESMVVDKLNSLNIFGLDYIINLAADKNCLHINNNIALKTAIHHGNPEAVEQILDNDAVMQQLKIDLGCNCDNETLLRYIIPKNNQRALLNNFNMGLINRYLIIFKKAIGIMILEENPTRQDEYDRAPQQTFAPLMEIFEQQSKADYTIHGEDISHADGGSIKKKLSFRE